MIINVSHREYKKTLRDHSLIFQDAMLPKYFETLKPTDCQELINEEHEIRSYGFKRFSDEKLEVL